MATRTLLIAICRACDEDLFYDKSNERFGHHKLPGDFHAGIPSWVRSKVVTETYPFTKADLISAESLFDLAYTQCTAHPCGCGYKYSTEAEYAAHFVLDNPNYLNLGNCPPRDGVERYTTSTDTTDATNSVCDLS